MNYKIKYLFFIFLFLCQITLNAQKSAEKLKSANNICDTLGSYTKKLEVVKGNYPKKNFLALLGRDNSYADTVTLSIIDERILKVEFKDLYGPCYELYEGKQKKNYFQFYLVKKRFFIPIFYSQVDIQRYRLRCLNDEEIEIKEYHNNSSNVFFMAAGGSSHNTYLLKK